jgi:hypothetical protein
VHSAPPELSRRKSYFSRGSVEDARRELRQLPKIDTTQNLRSLVVGLFDVIQEKRDQNVSWPVIHKAINGEVPIGLRTLMLYFGEEERERKRKAVVAAFAQIERKRAERMPWAQILASLPKLRMDADALKTYFNAEQRARKPTRTAK